MGELIVEYLRQGLGVTLVHGKDDGLANQGLALDAVGIDVSVVQYLGKLSHDRTVTLGDCEPTLESRRIDD